MFTAFGKFGFRKFRRFAKSDDGGDIFSPGPESLFLSATQ